MCHQNAQFFFIDDIFVTIGLVDLFFNRQSVAFLWAPIALIFSSCLYSYEEDFIHGLLKKNSKKLDQSFNFMLRYLDDVLSSLDYFKLGDYVDRIYSIELKVKDTTDTDRSATYLYLHTEIDSEGR